MTSPTLGQKIDTLLEPFVRDETQLQQRLEELQAQIELLQQDVAEAQRDLAVVGQSKIAALRDAAQQDPTLQAVFAVASDAVGTDSAGTDVGETVSVNAAPDAAGHPLLSPGE